MRLVLAAAAAAAGLAAANGALACSCVPYRSAAEQLAAADLMFQGRVLVQTAEGEGAVTRFRVYRVIKGQVGRNVQIRHRLESASCGVRFTPGRTVLVLAQAGADGFWRTGLCSAPRFPEDQYRRAARGEPVPVRPPDM